MAGRRAVSPWWFTAALAPLAYFLVANRHTGFHAQPDLARARTTDRFQHVVDSAGGRRAITSGVVIDVGFIVLFAVVATLLLAKFDGPWWLAFVPAALDLAQDLFLVLTAGTPRAHRLQVLMVVTFAMYAAYAATLVALLVAFARSF